MKNELIVLAVNSVPYAACGCGGHEENYDFAKVPARKSAGKKASDKSFMAPQASCDCGGTVKKIVLPISTKSNRENGIRHHHTKRKLPKNNRTTVRGMMTI